MSCPGSMKLTNNKKACKADLDFTAYCSIEAGGAPGWPSCGNQTIQKYKNNSLPTAPTGGAVVPPPKAKLEPSCSDILDVQYKNLLKTIQEIHEFEGNLFDKLQKVESGGSADMDTMEIKARISSLSNLRNQLYKDLNNILTSTQCNLADSRQNLADQLAMVKIVQKELDQAEAAIAEMQDIRNSRTRMVEITDYEKKRFESHKNIFRNVAFCGLGILFFVLLSGRGYKTIGNAGIVLTIAFTVITVGYTIWLNWWRDNQRWDRFNFGNQTGMPTETVFQYDKRHIEQGFNQAKDAVSNIENKAENIASNPQATLTSGGNAIQNALR